MHLTKEFHFIIGVNIIRKIKITIFIIFLSCASLNQKNINQKKINSDIKINTQQWNIDLNDVNLNLNISVPINYFVFTKNDEHFESKLVFTLILSENENKSQFHRESWRMKITKNDYKETRDSDNIYKFEKNIQCTPGKYNVYLK